MKAVLWVFIALLLATYITGPILDPDLWWHITVGRWILSNGAVPVTDHWNLFWVGKPWRAYSWSNEILFASIDQIFGIRGLLALKLTIALGLTLTFMYTMGRTSKDWFFGSLCGGFAALSTFDHFTLRPQALVWIYFGWLIYILSSIEEKGPSRNRYLGIVTLFCLWANTHLTAALGIITIIGWCFSRVPFRVVSACIFSALLGTLITPYFGGEWITFFSKTGHPFSHAIIAEFQPATILQYSTAFILFPAFLLGAFIFSKPLIIPLPRLLLILGFMLGALAVVKFLPFSVMLLCGALAKSWSEVRESGTSLALREGIERMRTRLDSLPREGLAFVLLALSVVNFYKVWKAPINLDIVPVSAIDFIEKYSLQRPLLNGFGNGGYVMYRFSDRQGNLEASELVPIDGRTNVIPHDLWEKFSASLRGTHRWREFIDAVKPRTILWKTESPMTSILKYGQEWCLVFQSGDKDMGYSVFVDKEQFQSKASELKSDNC